MKSFLRNPMLTSSAAIMAIAAGFTAAAGATVDPTVSSASAKVVSFFTSNLAVAVGAFIAVAGVLWILSLVFKSVGIHRRRSVG